MSDLSLVELIDVITRYIGELETRFLKEISESGLTAKQMEYLETVGRLKHPSLGELAEELSLSKPSVTAIVERLSNLGCIERVKSDADRRSAHVHITQTGEKLIALHDETHRQIASVFEKNLEPADLKSLTRILNRAISNLMAGK